MRKIKKNKAAKRARPLVGKDGRFTRGPYKGFICLESFYEGLVQPRKKG